MDEPVGKAPHSVGWFALVVVRGLLLWVVVPAGFIVWLLIGWIVDVRLGAMLGWLDLNLTAALQRVLVRQGGGAKPTTKLKFVPLRSLPTVEHRISPLAPL